MSAQGVSLQVGAADIEEGRSVGPGRASLASAHDEPAGLGPASECLAQMQNLRKVGLAPQQKSVTKSRKFIVGSTKKS